MATKSFSYMSICDSCVNNLSRAPIHMHAHNLDHSQGHHHTYCYYYYFSGSLFYVFVASMCGCVCSIRVPTKYLNKLIIIRMLFICVDSYRQTNEENNGKK